LLSPLPFLALKLPMWSGNGPKEANKRASAYSYSFQQSRDERKAIAEEGDEPSGEGEVLLREVLATLGETDPTSFRGAIEHYSADTIRTVLDRVRATPPEKLRKSRTAMFRFLLAKTKTT
jgi:hypothetical protein